MQTVSQPSFGTSLFVAVLCGFVAVGGFLLEHFADELGLEKSWEIAGRIALYVGLASCTAAWWVHKRYDAWIAESSRPPGLPMRNAQSLRQPLWLLVASMIIPYPALGALAFGATAVYMLVAGSTGAPLDPAKLAVGILAVVATSAYVLAVVTKRQHAGETSLGDLGRSACAFAALALTIQLYVPRLFTAEHAAPSGILAWICAAAVLATALFAFVAARDHRPKDRWGRDESPRWSYRKKKHA